jgi:hypothetical protein
MDRSQNFARSVGKEEMQTICECLRVTVSNLSNFFMGTIDAPRLKALLFGPLNEDKPMINTSQKNAKRKRVNPNKTSNLKNAKRRKLDQYKPVTPPVQNGAKKKKLDQDKPITPPVQNGARKKKLGQDKPVTPPIEKDAKKKKLNLDKAVTPTIQKDGKNNTRRPDLRNSHVQQKKSKLTVQTLHPGSGSRPPTVFVPPHQRHQPSTQLAHIPQQMLNHSLLAHGLVRPHLHRAYHPYEGLVVSQREGNSIHFNRGIQVQHQGQVMFGPSASHHPPVMDRLHPYDINGAHQQMQHCDNRFVQIPPYGMGPGFWR